jgi:hypothetical protein
MARDKIYPEEILALFTKLGIDHRKETEVYRAQRNSAGLHEYGGWHHFVGSIMSGKDCYVQRGENAWTVSLEPVSENFSIGFTKHVALVPKSLKIDSVTQVEFWVKVPWLLSTLEPE